MMQDMTPHRSHSHEMSATELSERAAGYVALAKDAREPDDRDTFERLAELCRTLAVERRAGEKQDVGSPTAH
jgi:hypothetical protein